MERKGWRFAADESLGVREVWGLLSCNKLGKNGLRISMIGLARRGTQVVPEGTASLGNAGRVLEVKSE